MKKAFDRITSSVIGYSLLAIILGLVLIFFPDISLKSFGIVSAIYMIVQGILMIILEIKFSKIFVPFENMLSGVVSIILGIVLLAYPNSVATLLAIAFGVWMIATSINNIKVSLFMKKVDGLPWILMLVFAVIEIALGLLVIFNPFEASITLTLYIGIMLVVHSIFNIVDMIILKRNVRNNENKIKEKMNNLISKFQ